MKWTGCKFHSKHLLRGALPYCVNEYTKALNLHLFDSYKP